MKTSDTISVNPGKTTLGHVQEHAANPFRRHVLSENSTSAEKGSLINVIFPSAGMGMSELRKYSLPLRTIFATILIVTGLSVLESTTPGFSLGYGIALMTAGAFLAIGFLTRPVMLASAAFLAIYGAIALRAGVVQVNDFSLMLGCLIFALAGSGNYSVDHIIRAHRNSKKTSISRKYAYKAFQIATKSF